MPRKRKKEDSNYLSDSSTDEIISLVEEFADGGFEEPATFVPKLNIQTKDKVSMTLVNKKIINQGQQYLQMEKQGNDPVTTAVNVSLDIEGLTSSNVSITGYEFNYYDKAIFDAICSLYFAGNEYISLPMIFRNLTSKDSHYNPAPSILESVAYSIEKMRRIDISINLEEELQYFKKCRSGYENIDTFLISEKFLNVQFVTVKMKGKIINVMKILSEPVLLKYARFRNQIAKYDKKILDTPPNKTREIIICQSYMVHRITTMKSSSKISRFILFDTIYSYIPDIEEKKQNVNTFKKFKKNLHSAIISILNYWKEINFIDDYNIHFQGKKYNKIEIILSSKNIS